MECPALDGGPPLSHAMFLAWGAQLLRHSLDHYVHETCVRCPALCGISPIMRPLALRGVPRSMRRAPDHRVSIGLRGAPRSCGQPPIILSVPPSLSYFLTAPTLFHTCSGRWMHCRLSVPLLCGLHMLRLVLSPIIKLSTPSEMCGRCPKLSKLFHPPSQRLGSRLALADCRDLSCVPPTPARSTGT